MIICQAVLTDADILVGLCLAYKDPADHEIEPRSNISIQGSILVLLGSIAVYSAYVWLLQVRPATQASTYAYVNPVIAVGYCICRRAYLANANKRPDSNFSQRTANQPGQIPQ